MAKKPAPESRTLSTGDTPDDVLLNWRSMSRALPDLTEDEVKFLMGYEARNKNRLSFKQRLFGRFSDMRTERERSAYLGH